MLLITIILLASVPSVLDYKYYLPMLPITTQLFFTVKFHKCKLVDFVTHYIFPILISTRYFSSLTQPLISNSLHIPTKIFHSTSDLACLCSQQGLP